MVQTTLFGATVGIGCLALAIDTGLEFNSRTELQAVADAAALAAASQLGSGSEAMASARTEAAAFAAANAVRSASAYVDPNEDVVFGHAALHGGAYSFEPNGQPTDAVKVVVRRDGSDSSRPTIGLLFSKAFSDGQAHMSASAVAMLVPRDIALVIDLSGSMNDDSELRHYKAFSSEIDGGTRPAVQVNLNEVWAALPVSTGKTGIRNGSNPASPGSLSSSNPQPATGSGTPQSTGGNPDPGNEPAGGSPNPAGPRWGWMTGWGSALTLGAYNPTADTGLYYIPKGSTTSSSDLSANLTESGYSSAERSALLSGQYDSTGSYYTNRVKVLTGLSGWKSGKSGGKYTGTGNGDNKVDNGELTQTVSWPFAGGSWSDYLAYMASTSTQMYSVDSSLRYRYGIKTVVNYLLEKRSSHAEVPELADTPEMPVQSAKDAVQAMIDLIVSLETQDHCSLEVFATTARHEVDLTNPAGGQSLSTLLQTIPATLNARQSNHYDSTTNIGAGIEMGHLELTSARARSAAAKVMIVLTDGKPNIGSGGLSPEDYVVDRATATAAEGITVYAIGLGGDSDESLLQQVAQIGHGKYFYADSEPDPVTGQPLYVTQLREIFEELGGDRPVRLIK